MRSNTATRLIVPTSPWLGPAFSDGNTAATEFATIAPTATKPTTDSTTGAAILPATNSRLRLGFYGTGTENTTFAVKIVGWSRLSADENAVLPPAQPGKNITWVPSGLAYLTIALGATTSYVGGVINGTAQKIVDNIVEEASNGYLADGVKITSPDDGLMATVEVGTLGFQMFGVYFDRTGGATANAIYANI